MKEIIQALSSPVWWLSVIFAGFAVNLVAAYTKPFLDKSLSLISNRYKDWSKDRNDRIGKVSYYLLDHPQEAAELRGQVIHLTLKLVLTIATGLFFTQALEFLIENMKLGSQFYTWLKILGYLCTTLIAVTLFQRYRLLASILKDHDSSVYSAADRFHKKKYD